jgi:hypothetical protein
MLILFFYLFPSNNSYKQLMAYWNDTKINKNIHLKYQYIYTNS